MVSGGEGGGESEKRSLSDALPGGWSQEPLRSGSTHKSASGRFSKVK